MCDCSCQVDTQNTPSAYGCIIVYELAIIIVILLLIYLDLDNTCKINKKDRAIKANEEPVVGTIE